jgi:hypothetical protein
MKIKEIVKIYQVDRDTVLTVRPNLEVNPRLR